MASKPKSTDSSSNPMNMFCLWYPELCRRYNTHPLSVIKMMKNKDNTVLDFVGDRIKYEDWTPILNAIRLDKSLHVISIKSRIKNVTFQHDVKCETRVRQMKRSFPVIWTTYVLKSLVTCLGICINRSEVLNVVELEGVAIPIDILGNLLSNLRMSRSVQMLSLKGCQLSDVGCKIVCTSLRLMPNIRVINMSSCNLTVTSAQYVANIIKHQQVERDAESWCNSLRYEDPEIKNVGGIRRITLNNNPEIGDAGLALILDVLVDDLYIKALDMQNCNITNDMAPRILDLVKHNKFIEVADFRHNKDLSIKTLTTILEAFEDKYYKCPSEPEFMWGKSDISLCGSGTISNLTQHSSATMKRIRSAPIRQTKSATATRSEIQERPVVSETQSVLELRAKVQEIQNELVQHVLVNQLEIRPKSEPVDDDRPLTEVPPTQSGDVAEAVDAEDQDPVDEDNQDPVDEDNQDPVDEDNQEPVDDDELKKVMEIMQDLPAAIRASISEAVEVWPSIDEAAEVWPSVDEAAEVWPSVDEAAEVWPSVDEAAGVWPSIGEAVEAWTSIGESVEARPFIGEAAQVRPITPVQTDAEPDRNLGAIPKKRPASKSGSCKSLDEPCSSTQDLYPQLPFNGKYTMEAEKEYEGSLLQYYCQADILEDETPTNDN